MLNDGNDCTIWKISEEFKALQTSLSFVHLEMSFAACVDFCFKIIIWIYSDVQLCQHH